jgi:hypothetical protein
MDEDYKYFAQASRGSSVGSNENNQWINNSQWTFTTDPSAVLPPRDICCMLITFIVCFIIYYSGRSLPEYFVRMSQSIIILLAEKSPHYAVSVPPIQTSPFASVARILKWILHRHQNRSEILACRRRLSVTDGRWLRDTVLTWYWFLEPFLVARV